MSQAIFHPFESFNNVIDDMKNATRKKLLHNVLVLKAVWNIKILIPPKQKKGLTPEKIV